jgi:DNA-binding NarL/FixJ family response regulator
VTDLVFATLAQASSALTTRLVLADDHPLILDGLERLFSREGFAIQALCLSGQDVLAAVQREQPDVLVLDLHMPKMDGLAVIQALKRQGLHTRVVILTDELSEKEALECLRLGVAGIVLKDMSPNLVLQCVQKVAAGDTWVEKRSFSRVMEHLLRREAGAQQIAGKLSARELEVVRLCAQGASNLEMAKSLALTEGTVKSHLHRAYSKLNLRGRADLVRFAHENGLI